MSKRKHGTCHLCGITGMLSFEHVPLRAAFNNRPVIEAPILETMDRPFDERPRGHINQRGAGAHTLCESCNNNTGDWYAGDFAAWSYQGRDVLVRSDFKPKLIYLHYIYPLRVIKQIYTMAFSINGARWRVKHPDLEAFVLNRERQWLNPSYRVFVYYNVEGTYRRVGNHMAMFSLYQDRVISITEMSFPPFGYVITSDGTCPDKRLYEITHFRRYEYNELEVTPLYLPVLPTHLPYPLDYRTRDEIEEQARMSIEEESERSTVERSTHSA